MGMKYSTQGGSGTGFGQDFASFLMGGLNGNFGGSGGSQNTGIGGFLNNVLGGGAGTLGGAMQQMLQTQQTNDINSIRSRYGVGGGTGFGTPAAYGEATYRAQAAPQITSAIGNLQMNALNSILPMMSGMASRDIPQAQTVGQQNPWVQAAGVLAPLAGGAINAGLFGGGLGGSGGPINFPGGMDPSTYANSVTSGINMGNITSQMPMAQQGWMPAFQF